MNSELYSYIVQRAAPVHSGWAEPLPEGSGRQAESGAQTGVDEEIMYTKVQVCMYVCMYVCKLPDKILRIYFNFLYFQGDDTDSKS